MKNIFVTLGIFVALTHFAFSQQYYSPIISPADEDTEVEIESEEPPEVTELTPPSKEEIAQWVSELDDRGAVVREAAIRRLLPFPQMASEPTVRAFEKGKLTTRLAALELLREWNAPIDGLDPWQAQSITSERLAALDAWQKETTQMTATLDATKTKTLTEQQRGEAKTEIIRMLRAEDAEAEAIRERLARRGETLLPIVYEQLNSVTSDHERFRLQALRYRLVAAEDLSERWPGGLLRLASTETAVRQKAAEELAELVTSEDHHLLRELFSDPNPLVREICLRGMKKIGGRTQTMLLGLLADPEPNVRAAVLKQLETNPGPKTSAALTEYVKTEKDHDLIGHAVLVLKALRKKNDIPASRALIELLKHESWQVRAEAAAALKSEQYYSQPRSTTAKLTEKQQLQADIYVALIERLDDEDNFVVSKAVESLSGIDMPVAVEPLLKALERHPELASQIVELLAESEKMRTKAIAGLRKMTQHEDPRIRAAIIRQIINLDLELREDEILLGLDDKDEQVRVAVLDALFQQLEKLRNSARRNVTYEANVTIVHSSSPPVISPIGGLLQLFGGSGSSAHATKKKKPKNEEVAVTENNGDLDFNEEPTEPVQAFDADEPAETPKEDIETAIQKEIAQDSSRTDFEKYDKWLEEFYRGKGRPEWMTKIIPRLQEKLDSGPINERLSAAALLVPLGKADQAVPFLLETSKSDPKSLEPLLKIVPWLVRDKRFELFYTWGAETSPGESELTQFLYRFAEPIDLRTEAIYWEILGDENVSLNMADLAFDFLKPLYLNDRFSYNSGAITPKRVREALIEKLLARIENGTEMQRFVAVLLLIPIDPEKAGEIAEKMDSDPSLSAELRRDMLQIRFLTQPNQNARTELAVKTLQEKDPVRGKVAIQSLVKEPYSLRILRNRFYVSMPSGYSYSGSQDRNQLKMPKGLKLETLKPLIEDANEEIAAYAGYFVAILGDPAGLEPLLKYRKKIQNRNVPEEEVYMNVDEPGAEGKLMDTLAYRAIASLDATEHVPVLREIYGNLFKDSSQVNDFYWTIRSMTSPEILEFRKEIRKVHGSNLR